MFLSPRFGHLQPSIFKRLYKQILVFWSDFFWNCELWGAKWKLGTLSSLPFQMCVFFILRILKKCHGESKTPVLRPQKCQPTLQNPAGPGGMKRWWNCRRWFWEGAARGGGFSVSLVYYVFFFSWRGAIFAEYCLRCPKKQVFMTLVILCDLQLGDKKVTLNHLDMNLLNL